MEARRSQSSTNGRRRRLLTTHDADDLLAEYEELAPAARPRLQNQITVAAPDRLILNRIISGHLWKHLVLIGLFVMLSAVAVWLEHNTTPAVADFVQQTQTRLSKGLAGVFLLLAGQCALLIAWVRSRSSVDYNGRYRCWKWLAGSLTVISLLWLTNLQNTLPQLTRWTVEPFIGVVGAARHTIVVVPLSGLSLWVLCRVIPDMGRNRWAQALFTVGVGMATVRLVLSWSSSLAPSTTASLDAVLVSATTATLAALLLHCRFVLYVSNDPPERKQTGRTAPPADEETCGSPADTFASAAAPETTNDVPTESADESVESPPRRKGRSKKQKTSQKSGRKAA